MQPYYIISFLLIITGIFNIDYRNRKNENFSLLLIGIIVILFTGLRTGGYDYESYYDHFKAVTDFFSYTRRESTFEAGYEYIVSIFKLVSNNYNGFLLFYSLMTIVMLCYLCKKYSPYPVLSLIMFCGPFIFTQLMGQMRQPFANCLLYILIIPLLLHKKQVYSFIIAVLIGFLFHKSIILLAIFIPFMGVIYSKYQVRLLLLMSVGFFLMSSILQSSILELLPDSFLFAKIAINYMTSDVSYNLGMLERAALFVIIIYFSKKYKLYQKDSLFRIFLNLYGLGFLLYISLIHVSAEFAVRGTNGLYFSLIFIFPMLINKANGLDRYLLFIGSIMWVTYLLLSFLHKVPIEYNPYIIAL